MEQHKDWPIRRLVRIAALGIVSMAAVRAGTIILPASGATCSYTQVVGGSGDCSGGAAQLALSDGIEGVQFFTDGPVALSEPGGSVTLSTNGPVAGGIPSGVVIPVSWDFTFAFDANIPLTWTLDFNIVDVGTGSSIGSVVETGSGLGSFTGVTPLTTTAASDDVTVSAEISFVADPEQAGVVSLDIPAGSSLDVNSLVPEPGSIALTACGLAWLGWRRFQKKCTS